MALNWLGRRCRAACSRGFVFDDNGGVAFMRLLRDLVVLLSLVAVMFFGAVASASASTSKPDSISEALAARAAGAWVFGVAPFLLTVSR